MVLCFRLVTKTRLIARFSCGQKHLHSIGALCFSLCPPSVNSLGALQEVRRGHDHTGNPNWSKRYSVPYNITLSNKKGEEGILGGLAIFWSWTGWATVYLCEVVSDCLCMTFACFASSSTYLLLIKQFQSWCTSFLAFTLPFLLPHPVGGQGKQTSSCVVLHCLPGLNHNKDGKLTESEKVKQCDS